MVRETKQQLLAAKTISIRMSFWHLNLIRMSFWHLNLMVGFFVLLASLLAGVQASYRVQDTFQQVNAAGWFFMVLVWAQALIIIYLGCWVGYQGFQLIEISELTRQFIGAQLWIASTGLMLGAFCGTLLSQAFLYFLMCWAAVTQGVMLGAGPQRLRHLKTFVFSQDA